MQNISLGCNEYVYIIHVYVSNIYKGWKLIMTCDKKIQKDNKHNAQ